MSQRDKSVMCVIPVRGCSKGLPGKNLKHLEGESPVARASERPEEKSSWD
jgi:CMP-N-acetylneuraminic acid synthetase